MKRTTKIVTGVAVVALGVATLAGIAGASGYSHSRDCQSKGMHGMSMHGGGHRDSMMQRFDTNSDGKITAAEMQAMRDKALADHDADKDGKLSLDEFQGVWLDHMRPRMVRFFQHLDADGDAQVTMEEMQVPMQRMMSRMDRNEDGVISKDDRGHHGWRHHREDDDDDDDRRGPMRKYNK